MGEQRPSTTHTNDSWSNIRHWTDSQWAYTAHAAVREHHASLFCFWQTTFKPLSLSLLPAPPFFKGIPASHLIQHQNCPGHDFQTPSPSYLCILIRGTKGTHFPLLMTVFFSLSWSKCCLSTKELLQLWSGYSKLGKSGKLTLRLVGIKAQTKQKSWFLHFTLTLTAMIYSVQDKQWHTIIQRIQWKPMWARLWRV